MNACLRLMLALALLGASIPAQAQDKALRIIVSTPAGAAMDSLGRLLADRMRVSLAQTVIVENRTGAGGRIAAEYVKAAAPDGNTIMLVPFAVMVPIPLTHRNLSYDVFNDFAPVAHVASFDLGLAVGPAAAAKTLGEYLAMAKTNPRLVSFGTPGAGSLPHFFGIMVGRGVGVEMLHIPYKGSAPAVTDLLGGQIAAIVVTVADVSELHRTGKARVLASSGARRSQALPDVPTFRELGYDIEATPWYALFAPKNAPRGSLERISAAAVGVLKTPEVRERLLKSGLLPTGSTPDELAAILKADYEKWGPVIKASGFVADD
jgi:tripartite-type tricarboxylate transporter receptor subunit TctC